MSGPRGPHGPHRQDIIDWPFVYSSKAGGLLDEAIAIYRDVRRLFMCDAEHIVPLNTDCHDVTQALAIALALEGKYDRRRLMVYATRLDVEDLDALVREARAARDRLRLYWQFRGRRDGECACGEVRLSTKSFNCVIPLRPGDSGRSVVRVIEFVRDLN